MCCVFMLKAWLSWNTWDVKCSESRSWSSMQFVPKPCQRILDSNGVSLPGLLNGLVQVHAYLLYNIIHIYYSYKVCVDYITLHYIASIHPSINWHILPYIPISLSYMFEYILQLRHPSSLLQLGKQPGCPWIWIAWRIKAGHWYGRGPAPPFRWEDGSKSMTTI